MLHNFLENDLSGNNEETLFHALARDEDLRFEMKYLLNLKAAVAEDDEAAVIPVATTSSLFSRLGYSIPATVAAAGTATRGGLFDTWGKNILSGLLGVLLASTFFLVGNGGNGDDGTSRLDEGVLAGTAIEMRRDGESMARDLARLVVIEGAPQQQSSEITSIPPVPRPKGTAPLARSQKRTESRNQVVTTTNELEDLAVASEKIDPPPSEKVDLVQPTRTADELFAMESTTDRRILTDDNDDATELLATLQMNEKRDESNDMLKRSRERGLALSARGSLVPFTLKESEMPQFASVLPQESGPTDFAVGLELPLPNSPSLSAVVEAGRESYLLTFRDTRPNGTTTLHEAEPTVLWATLGLRWSPLQEWAIAPFGQVALGGSGSGIMERFMLGTTWRPGGPVELTGGLELSMTQYQFKGSWLNSPRLGLSYGVQWNLGE